MTERWKGEQYDVQQALRGMVPEAGGDSLDFRRAEPGEKPMNHGQRRQVAQLLTRGFSDDQVREVIASW